MSLSGDCIKAELLIKEKDKEKDKKALEKERATSRDDSRVLRPRPKPRSPQPRRRANRRWRRESFAPPRGQDSARTPRIGTGGIGPPKHTREGWRKELRPQRQPRPVPARRFII